MTVIPLLVIFLLQASDPIFSDNRELLYSDKQVFNLSAPEIKSIISTDSSNMNQALKRPVKPTFKMMALEWLGGVGGGLAAGGAMYYLTVPLTENAQSDGPYAICFTLSLASAFFGIAGGTTLVGNAITEPNGSFGKACLGELAFIPVSAVFTGVGAALMIASAPSGPGDHMGNPSAWFIIASCIIGAGIIFPPPYGAVMGYNSQRMCCCSAGVLHEPPNESKLFNPSFKIQLIKYTIK